MTVRDKLQIIQIERGITNAEMVRAMGVETKEFRKFIENPFKWHDFPMLATYADVLGQSIHVTIKDNNTFFKRVTRKLKQHYDNIQPE